MEEASRIIAEHGDASIAVLEAQIREALKEGDEAEALRIDQLLQKVEQLLGSTSA